MLKLGIVLGLLALFFSVGVYWAADRVQRPLQMSEPQTLIVRKGDHLTGIAKRLSDTQQLPWAPAWVTLYARLMSDGQHIQVGEYELLPNMTVPQLIQLLHSGDVIQRQITFPEGWSTDQWLDLLSENSFLTDNTFESLSSYVQPIEQWEGQLYPDTYAFTRGDSAKSILIRAKSRMRDVLEQVWQERSLDAVVTSAHDALILASMIEKETGYGGDRGLISSVFNNRLKIGMKLQSDPTVIYGLKNFDGDLKRRHLRIPHEYNTYVIKSLPVAPICNPGKESLVAALHPESSDYLYFVARGDGKSQFSRSLEEHNRAVFQFQKAGRVENYRSVPNQGNQVPSTQTDASKVPSPQNDSVFSNATTKGSK